MAKSVDERVVRMTFENEKFEKNAQSTMKTLDKLKESLKFKGAAKGLEEVNNTAKRVDLNILSKSVEEVQAKFSALQVVGATALSNLTTSAMHAGASITHALTDSLVGGGIRRAKNLEQANFQLKGLGIVGEKLEQVMSDVSYSVDGTAYGLDVAARAAAQFSASGVEAGDNLRAALRGISGVAAMTGSSYEDISRVFTGIAGQNRVMGNDLLQLSGRGINVAASMAKAMNKSESEIREMVSKGKIDFATFAKIMDETFGEHSKAANETFSGALSNMKAALSRIGADVATPGLTNLRDVFNALRETINDTHKKLAPFLEDINRIQTEASKSFVEFVNLGGLQAIIDGIGNIFQAFSSIIRPIKETLGSIIPTPTVQQLVDLANGFRDLTSKLILTDEALSGFQDKVNHVASVLQSFFQAARWGSANVQKWLADTHLLSDGINNFSNAFLDFIFNVSDSIDLGDTLSSLIDGLGNSFSFLGGLLQILSSLAGVITSVFTGALTNMNEAIVNLTSGVGTGLQGVVEVIFRILEIIPQGIANIVSRIGEALKTIITALPIHEINAIIQDSLSTVILSRLAKITAGVNNFTGGLKVVFGDIQDIASGITGVLDAAQNSLKSFAMSIKAGALLKIAIAVGVLAFALKSLADVPIEDLGKSLGVLTGGLIIMSAVIVALSAVIGKTQKGIGGFLGLNNITTQLIKVSVSMAIFSQAIKIMTEAMKELAGLSWGEILKGLVSLTGMTAILIVMTRLMGNTKGLIKASASLIILSFGIKMLAEAFHVMDGVNTSAIIKGLVSLAVSMTILAATMKMLGKNTKGLIKTSVSMILLGVALQQLGSAVKGFDGVEGASLAKAGGMMLAIVAMIKLLSKTGKGANLLGLVIQLIAIKQIVEQMGNVANIIKQYDEISPESLGKFISAMLVFIGGLALLTASDKEMGKFLQLSGGMWGISEALKTMANAVQMFGGMDTKELAKGLLAVIVGLKAMVFVMNSTPEKSIIQSSFAFVLLAVAVNSLGKSIQVFSGMDLNSLVKGLAAFIILMGTLAISMKLMSKSSASIVKAALGLFIMSMGISALVAPIKTLGRMDTGDLAKGMIGLAASLTIVGVAASILGNMALSMVKTAVGLTAMSISMLVFGVALSAVIYPIKSLAGMNIGSLASGIAGLGAIITTMYVLINTMNSLPKLSVKTVAKIAVMGLLIGGIAAIIAQLSSVDTSSALAAAGALTAVILSTSVAIGILSLIPVVGALQAILTLAAIIAGMSAIVVAMGAIAQIPGVKWIVSEGATLMKSIGEAIGGFFGGIIGGAAAGILGSVGSALPAFGSSLSSFAIAAAPFFMTMNSINPESLQGVKALAEMILIITAADILNSATGWLTGGNSLVDFAAQLLPFGEAMKQYAETVAGIDVGAVEGSANAGKALAELATSLPSTGGLLQDIMGTQDLSLFTSQLIPFGEGIKKYAETVTGLDVGAVEASANAGKVLSELATSLPSTGGIWQELMGNQDLSTFATSLLPFGEAIKKYADSVKGIDVGAVEGSANAGKALASVATSLPSAGGVWQSIMGTQDLASFAFQLIPFGVAMKAYAEAVKGTDPAAVEASANAGRALVELVNALPNVGGLIQEFTGQYNLASFAFQLIPFGVGMKAYANAVTGIDVGAIEASANAGKALVSLCNELPKTGGLLNGIAEAFSGKTNIISFIKHLMPFGVAMKGFSLAVTGMDTGAVEASANAGKALASLIEALPKEGGLSQAIFGVASDLTDFTEQLPDFGKAMVAYGESIKGMDPGAVEASANAGKALISLINELPKKDGFFADLSKTFFGKGDLTSITEKLAPFGEAMKKYSDSIAGMDPGLVENSTNAAKALTSLIAELPKDGGWLEGLDGQRMSLETFGSQLEAFGPKYKTYYENVSNFEDGKIQASVNGIKTLSEVANGLNEESGERLTTFAEALTGLGEKYSAYYNTTSEINGEVMQNTTNALNAVIDLCNKIPETINDSKLDEFGTKLKEVGTNGITEFINGINENTQSAIDSITNLLTTINTTMQTLTENPLKTTFKQSAELAMKEYKLGIDLNVDTCVESIRNLAQSCVNKLNSFGNNFFMSGRMAASGYAMGLNRNAYLAVNAARNVGQQAKDALAQYNIEGSPSRLYAKRGMYAVAGYAEGFKKYGYLAENQAKNLGSVTLKALSTSINKANEITESDMEFSPKITPVIDLNNVKTGINEVGSLLNNRYAIPLEGTISKISSLSIQNGSDLRMKRLGHSIDQLSTKIDSLEPGPTLHINGAQINRRDEILDTIYDLFGELQALGDL